MFALFVQASSSRGDLGRSMEVIPAAIAFEIDRNDSPDFLDGLVRAVLLEFQCFLNFFLINLFLSV